MCGGESTWGAGEGGKTGGERETCGGVGGGEECKECGGVVGRGCERGGVKDGWVGSAEGGVLVRWQEEASVIELVKT